MIVDRNSLKNSSPPIEQEVFNGNWTFPAEMGPPTMAEHVPEGMGDLPEGVTINEGWVSRKTEEYSSTDIDQDVELALTLLNEYFRLP